MEESPVHTPTTESQFLLTLMDSFFVFGEEDSLPHLIPPESSSSDQLALPSLPLPPPPQTPTKELSLSLCSSSAYFPALKHSGYLVSGVSHQPLSSSSANSKWCGSTTRLVDQMAPPPASDPLVLTPPPSLLPPSAPAGTIECLAPLGSFGTSALPGLNITITKQQTCGSSTALCLAPPSLRLNLCPQSLQFHLSPPAPCFHLGGLSLWHVTIS